MESPISKTVLPRTLPIEDEVREEETRNISVLSNDSALGLGRETAAPQVALGTENLTIVLNGILISRYLNTEQNVNGESNWRGTNKD